MKKERNKGKSKEKKDKEKERKEVTGGEKNKASSEWEEKSE